MDKNSKNSIWLSIWESLFPYIGEIIDGLVRGWISKRGLK